MEKYFRTEEGERVNLVSHALEIMKENPFAEIRIGTDSQNSRKDSKYATVVVFRFPHRGAHYIYQVTQVPKIKDLFTRLFKECELSVEIAEFMKESGFHVSAIELDYNNMKVTKSTPLVAATTGWVTSLGYKAICKNGDMIATKAGDFICRR